MTTVTAEEPRIRGGAAVWALAATLFVVPLLTGNLSAAGFGGLPLFYDSIALPRLVIGWVGLLVALTMWAVGASLAEDGPRPAQRTHVALWLLAGVGVLATISAFTGVDPAFSILGQSERLEGLVTWWGYAVWFKVALLVVRGQRDMRLLAVALTASATLLAAYGLVQFAGLDWATYVFDRPGFDVRRAFATFGNPNFFAGLLVLAWPIAVGLAFERREGDAAWRSTAWYCAAAVLVGALFATFTRGAWFAAAVQAMVLSATLLRTRSARDRKALGALGATVALVAALIAVSLQATGEINIVDRLTKPGSDTERALTLRTAVAATAARPLLGWGPDAFLPAFRAVRLDEFAEDIGASATINNAHNWPLQAASTLGIPAALLFVTALAWVLASSAKYAFARGPGSETRSALYSAIWIGCIGFVLHMMLNVAVYGATLPFFVLLGAVAVPAARVQGFLLPRQAWWVATAVCAIAAVAAGVFGGRLLLADAAYQRSRAVYNGVATGDAVALARRASALNPLSVKYRRGLAEALAELYYEDAASGADPAEVRRAFGAADAAFRDVIARHPNDYPARAWHAAMLAAASLEFAEEELARRAVEQARAAERLDAHAQQVSELARGSTESGAIMVARSVPRLP